MVTSLKELDDEQLIKRVAKGCDASFEVIFERYQAKGKALAWRYLKDHEDAEDAVQAVFTRVFNKAHLFRGESRFSSWFFRIVVNEALMALRKRNSPGERLNRDALRMANSELYNIMDKNLPEDPYECHHKAAMIRLVTEKLPEHYRPTFEATSMDGMTSEQTGTMLGISVPAVKSRLHRAKILFRRQFKRTAYYENAA